MSVVDELNVIVANSLATELEKEIARALASAVDKDGNASAVKELRKLLTDIEQRKPEADSLDDLAKKRAARRNSA